MNLYLVNKFKKLAKEKKLLEKPVEIKCFPLDPVSAIGKPERNDFPLLKGKERLMEAIFLGSRGQAYADEFGDFSGSLADVLSMELKRNFERAVFISTLNAVMRHLSLINQTVHCRNSGPGVCAEKLVQLISERFGSPRVALVGFQPAMAEKLSARFPLQIVDLDPDNIGKEKFGIVIKDGNKDTKEVLNWCDLALITGTSAVNQSLDSILQAAGEKAVIVYGVSIAGVSYLLGLERFCPESC